MFGGPRPTPAQIEAQKRLIAREAKQNIVLAVLFVATVC